MVLFTSYVQLAFSKEENAEVLVMDLAVSVGAKCGGHLLAHFCVLF